MINLLKWLPALATALAMLLAQRSLMHDFQLESYQFPGYFRTLRRNWKRALLPGVTLAAYLTLLYLAYRSIDRMLDMSVGKILLALVNAALAVAGGWWCRSIFQQKKAKKPFVVTMRVKRTYIVMGVVYTLLCTPIALLTKVYFCGLLPLLLPLWVALGGLLAWPIEKLVSEMYFRDAQKKLAARPDIIKIGITGSYGKTSVKFILGTILQEKYQTLITPSSFNTPMGVTKIIRERLTPATQVFVAEMGARHVGDIKELCRLVHPRYGVLTSVGPQHLDTFHTLERIKNTKYELMDAVPADGCCFFPDDGAICRELYDRTEKEKRLCCLHYSPDADVWATDVTVSPMGSRFVLHTSAEEIACETRLLGEHNIQNILLAATVALHLGLTMRQVARGISKLQPVEHRLQLIPSPGITIIDDAFNSNPKGAEAAVKVLGAFQARRIIITPGMVELGGQEAAFNREFGRKICGNADIAILVGKKHTQPIGRRAARSGLPAGKSARRRQPRRSDGAPRQIGRPGDIAMFENDLPDHYSET